MQETRDVDLIHGSVRSPRGGGGHSNPLQYSWLQNPMDRRAWQATVSGSQRIRHDWSDLAQLYIHTDTHISQHIYYHNLYNIYRIIIDYYLAIKDDEIIFFLQHRQTLKTLCYVKYIWQGGKKYCTYMWTLKQANNNKLIQKRSDVWLPEAERGKIRGIRGSWSKGKSSWFKTNKYWDCKAKHG